MRNNDAIWKRILSPQDPVVTEDDIFYRESLERLHKNGISYWAEQFEQKVVDAKKDFMPMLTMVSKGIFIHSHYYDGHRCIGNPNKICDKMSVSDIMESTDCFNIYGNLKEHKLIELHNNTYILTEKGSVVFNRIKESKNES